MIYPANRADARFVGNEIGLKRKREARGLPFCRYHDGLDCTSQPNGCLSSLPYDKLVHTLRFVKTCFQIIQDFVEFFWKMLTELRIVVFTVK